MAGVYLTVLNGSNYAYMFCREPQKKLGKIAYF